MIPEPIPELLAEAVERARVAATTAFTENYERTAPKTPEEAYQRQAEEAAKDAWRQVSRFPAPMRTRHLARHYDVAEISIRRWRRIWRETGKLTGPRWDAVNSQTVLYRKSDVVAAMVIERIGTPPAPSRFAAE
ncbi:MAG: hypothetical protein AAFY80_06970 [Pseudomonadota bacterium]